ncbi:MAG: hypothetical protein PHS80_10935 [Methanothrix sp.]|nr:hypothetical protein [Methanothrix sp.]MDD4448537.1 hypothetical protein [Methanothrix sp.]
MNKGIIVQGNASFSAVNIATGDNASIINNAKDINRKKEIERRLDELGNMLMDCRDNFDNTMELISDVILVREEIKKETPDKEKIDIKINRLATSVSSIASIASALNAIKATISNFI